VPLAVLLDPVCQTAEAPVFALLDRAAVGFQVGADVVGDLIDLQQLEVKAEDATLSVVVKYVIRATQQQQQNTFVRSAP